MLVVVVAMGLGAVVPRGGGGAPGGETVLVIAGPIHTDVALPVDARTRELFGFVEAAGVPLGDPRARWILFGWGGRAFYLETPRWRDLRPGPVLRALTVDRAALHVDVIGDVPDGVPGVVAVELPPGGRERLEGAILRTFSLGPRGEPLAIPGEAYGATDAFFEAEGRFNLFLGCNTWTGAVLREAGLRTGWWTPLPQTLVPSLRWLNAEAVTGPEPR